MVATNLKQSKLSYGKAMELAYAPLNRHNKDLIVVADVAVTRVVAALVDVAVNAIAMADRSMTAKTCRTWRIKIDID